MKRRALVVVDMQVDFVTGCLGTVEAKNIVENLVNYIRNFDGDIYFTRDTHNENYMDTQEGKRLPVPHCIKDTDGWEIIPELKTVMQEKAQQVIKVIDKPTFGSVELATILAQNGYDEIEFCGVCTGICVISNAMLAKAYMTETNVTILKDLCACVTPESHTIALNAMATCQIDIK